MAESYQDTLKRVRAPRVRIDYKVETEGAEPLLELPFVVGVLADLSGMPAEANRPLKQRKFVPIDRDSFGDVMNRAAPRVAFRVANKVDEKSEELLNVARRRLGLGKSKMHQHLDLAEGTMHFREGRYEEALASLERCFLNAFAINDSTYGSQSGVLLLKTLVALGRYTEASEFGLGVRQLSESPEVDHLVALANNRKESLVSQ